MKKNLFKKLVAVTALGALILGTITGCGAKKEESDVVTIHAVTAAMPRPFAFYGDDNNLTGHNIKLIEAVFDRLPQYELEWEVTDFPSIFAGLDSDKYQLGVNNLSKNAERQEKYLFTDPMFENEFIVVANSNIALGDEVNIEDLAGLTYIGATAITYTSAVENFNEAHPDEAISITYTDADLNIQIDQVQSGAADFTIIDAPMYFGYYVPEFGYDLPTAKIVLSDDIEGNYSFFVVSKGNEQLVEDINKALYEVIADGTSKKINEEFFGGDYSPALDALSVKK